MQVRARLNEVLDGLDNIALLRIYDLALVYQTSSQLQARNLQKTQSSPDRLKHYLRAQEILAEVQGNLSDDIIALREDRI
ncbi:MAG: hypothetical protein WBO46_11685 [Caldilineaceae bacterium]